ncbi:MAG: nucleotide exchange factor GrpE [Rothia sp. (in: high G+C Gram-positive bacteria)]|nr:nucleotide exchange factor GrpE [Rothia sp. (in: high G+C Gram-positive bacteria)]
MADNTPEPEGRDPLEEAFEAPAAPGHPEADGVAEQGPASEADRQVDAEDSEQAQGPETAKDFEQLAADRLDDLLRLQAEFTNFKNRTAKEKEQLGSFIKVDLISALLPVIDDIDAARNHGDLAEGPFAAIAKKLEEILVKQGLQRYGTVGETFDPTIHEAVLQQPTSEVEPDQIALVLRNGYKVQDRVVRTAQVAVAVAE